MSCACFGEAVDGFPTCWRPGESNRSRCSLFTDVDSASVARRAVLALQHAQFATPIGVGDVRSRLSTIAERRRLPRSGHPAADPLTREVTVTLENMFYISQTAAAIAIVGSLLFVGLEVRNSNRESRHRTIEEMIQNYRNTRSLVTENPEFAAIWLTGIHSFSQLTAVEKLRFTVHATNFFSTHESVFLQYRDGRMSRELYEPQRLYLHGFLGYSGLKTVWDARRSFFHPAFRAMVDKGVADAAALGSEPQLYFETSTP